MNNPFENQMHRKAENDQLELEQEFKDYKQRKERAEKAWLAFEMYNDRKADVDQILEYWEELDPPSNFYARVMTHYSQQERELGKEDRERRNQDKSYDEERLVQEREDDERLAGMSPQSHKDFDEYFLPENSKIKAFILEKLAQLAGKQEMDNMELEIVLGNLDWAGPDLFIYRNHLEKLLKTINVDGEVDYTLAKIIFHLKRGVKNYNETQKKFLMIISSDVVGVDKLRDYMAKKIDQEKKEEQTNNINNLGELYSLITPNSDKQAITNLQNFYQNNIKFEEYEVNQKMNEAETTLLKGLIGKNEKVLEMGCGTGRLTAELAKDGFDITGFDFTKRHAEITKQAIEKNGQEGKVFQGDWHHNAVKDGGFSTVYSLGRNILHDYSIVDQVQLFREAARILRPGGKFIFDIPDREKGGYKKMVDGYAEEMRKRGINNFRRGAIYDSPNGEHFATRYAYAHEDIKELAELAGFKIKEIKKEALETGQGDENLYYVLEKIEKVV